MSYFRLTSFINLLVCIRKELTGFFCLTSWLLSIEPSIKQGIENLFELFTCMKLNTNWQEKRACVYWTSNKDILSRIGKFVTVFVVHTTSQAWKRKSSEKICQGKIVETCVFADVAENVYCKRPIFIFKASCKNNYSSNLSKTRKQLLCMNFI
jgi:hypothetical protein